MREQIGLVIWGCKGGYRATPSNGGPFCSNNVVNTGDEVIAQTVKDIRLFFRIHRTGHDFYAIEFTPKYKVFTNYRSSNDSGSGAFIAFTLYVPHALKVENMRAMFKEMMDAYFRDYMNPLTNMPLTGKYDDINKFLPILDRYKVSNDQRYFRQPSAPDDNPQLVIYDDVSIVDKYFDSPYRQEFYRCQEVVFLSKEIYDNAVNYQVEFVSKPIVIEKISEPEAESKLINNLSGLRLTSLVINGENMLQTNGNCPLSDSDTISFSIEKNEFCEEFVTKSLTPGRALTAKEAVDNRWLRRVNQKDFEFVQPVKWVPKKYFLSLSNTGVDTDKLCGRVFLSDNYRRIELKKLERGCFFELAGEEVNSMYSLCLVPVKATSDKPYFLTVEEGVRPLGIMQRGLHTSIIEKIVYKTSKSPDRYQIYINIGEFNLGLAKSDNKTTLLLPSSKQTLLKLSFKAEGYNAEFDGENVSFVPAFMYLYISKDIMDVNIYNTLRLQFEVGDDRYDSMLADGKGLLRFKLPYKQWLALKNGMSVGRLFCGDEELGYTINKDYDRISIQAVIVNYMDRTPVYVTIQKGAISETLQMGYNNTLILSRARTISVDENMARLLDFKSNDNLNLKKIVLIKKEKMSDEKGDDEINGGIKQKRVITFINCQNFSLETKKGFKVIKDEVYQATPTSDEVLLWDKKGNRVVCTIKVGINENCNKERFNEEFIVQWKNDNYSCDVEYRKESIVEKIKKFKKLIFGVGAFILVVGLGVAIYPFIKQLFASDYEYLIAIKSEGVIDSIGVQPKSDFAKFALLDNNLYNLSLKVPSDKINEFNKFLNHNIELKIYSKLDGDTTILLSDILGGDKTNKIRTFFMDESEIKKGYDEIHVSLPSVVRLNEMINNSEKSANLAEYLFWANKYPGKHKDYSRLAFDVVRNSGSKDLLLEYIKLSDENIENFKVEEFYDSALSALTAMQKAREEEEARIAKEENQKRSASNLVKGYNKELSSLEISAKRVVEILEELKKNNIGDNAFKEKCNTYLSFFLAKKIDDVNDGLAKKYFTSQQFEVWEKVYKKNFNFVRDSYGMNFKEGRWIGIQSGAIKTKK